MRGGVTGTGPAPAVAVGSPTVTSSRECLCVAGAERTTHDPRVDAVPATERIAALHRRFAAVETPGRSPLYGQLAHDVAADAELLAFLATLPEPKWQPQLLFSAVQFLQGPLTSRAQFADAVRTRRGDVAAVMRSHTTQTNIPARCATLLPALAALPQPLALVEVGASAGLCLYPDRYSYDYGGHRVTPRARPGSRPSGAGRARVPRCRPHRSRSCGARASTCTRWTSTTPTTSPGSTPWSGRGRSTCARSCTPRSTSPRRSR